MRVDVHQHIWTEPLVEALARRTTHPFVRRVDGSWILHAFGEQPYVIDLVAERPRRRRAQLDADSVDRAIVALSSPVGIEALPREEAEPLIGAYLDGATALPDGFDVWGAVPLDGPIPDDVDHVLALGCVGLSLPAGALAGPSIPEPLMRVLERLEELGAPLFVHPGPGPRAPVGQASIDDPLWWPALTRYVADMQSAWLTFQTNARRDLGQLRVLFALLAGGAPLHHERLAARGGPPVADRDPLTFYDTSSYGPDMVGALERVVGSDALVYGSDRPVALPGRFATRFATNAVRLLAPARVAATA